MEVVVVAGAGDGFEFAGEVEADFGEALEDVGDGVEEGVDALFLDEAAEEADVEVAVAVGGGGGERAFVGRGDFDPAGVVGAE